MKKFLNAFVAISAAMLFAGNVSAAVYECVDDATGDGVASGGHTASSSITTDATVDISNCGPWEGNDPGDLTATTGGYGYNDWSVVGDTDGSMGIITTYTGAGTTSGTFAIGGDSGSDYLIVLKFDGVFASYLTNGGISGEWNTDTDGDGKFDISHMRVYGRDNGDVPEPGPLALLAIGLLGVGLRRIKQAR